MQDYKRSALLSENSAIAMELERELAAKAQAGCIRSRNKLVEANLRWVLKRAHIRYNGVKRHRSNQIGYEDFVQSGVEGLIRATEKFDPKKGRLTTYATWWIDQKIRRDWIDSNRTIRLSINVQDRQRNIKKFAGDYWQEHKRYPTVEQIAEGTKITLQSVKDALAHRDIDSLDRTAGFDDGDRTVGEAVADPTSYSQDQREMMDTVRMLVSSLPEKERQAVELVYGFNGDPLTLEEAGKLIPSDRYREKRNGLSRERVRQLLMNARRRLRSQAKELGITGVSDVI